MTDEEFDALARSLCDCGSARCTGSNQIRRGLRAGLDRGAALRAAAEKVVDTWRSNGSRVFEVMGDDNPRALAIDDDVAALRRALGK